MSDHIHQDIPGTINILKKIYAINLLWNQVEQGQKPVAAAKEGAKLINTDIACINNNLLGYQYGLAEKKIGHKPGMLALATKIDTSQGALCGVWKINDSVWLVIAVNRDGIVINDKGYFYEEQAKDDFFSIVYSDEWDKIVCPEIWGVNGSVSIPFEHVLNKKPAKKIRKIVFSVKRFILFLLVLILICAFVDFIYSYFFKEDDGVLQPQSQLQESSSSLSVNDSEDRPKKILAPWSNKPEPYSMITQCIYEINREYLNAVSIPGWLWSEKALCDGKRVFFPVTKGAGTKLWLYSADVLITPPPSISNITDNSAELSWAVMDVFNYKKLELFPEDLNDVKRITDFLLESFTQSSEVIKISPPSQLAIGSVVIAEVDFKYTTNLDPRVFLPILDDVGSFTIKSISYSFAKKEWDVNGVFYGKIK